uniref:Uncharacterized protein n=1 Tax=Aegilops tauschii subsp. strangulata TaxID=200361 RepID=A0A453SQA1_AEGTS
AEAEVGTTMTGTTGIVLQIGLILDLGHRMMVLGIPKGIYVYNYLHLHVYFLVMVSLLGFWTLLFFLLGTCRNRQCCKIICKLSLLLCS